MSTDRLNAWAEIMAELEAENRDLQAENNSLRELLSVSLERLAALTGAHQHQRRRIADLLHELRGLRDRAHTRRAA